MESMEDANSKLFPANEPDHEFYTIPSHSSWFSWNDIHETERISLKEFFNGTSISKQPKIYKEYRDFIINKYREDPSRRLKFTEIRKSLVGDVNLIYKVFQFLEKWGLINFGAPEVVDDDLKVDEEKQKIVYEEGAPNGVKVVAFPNSVRVLSKPGGRTHFAGGGGGELAENDFRLPPLASYKDVFGELSRLNKFSCVKCGDVCGNAENSESDKESIVTCSKCLELGKDEDSKAVKDIKLKDSKGTPANHGVDSWTDAEILLLLESILLHGDDWDLVAQNVRTRSKSDCIAKLIELPFGELMLSTTKANGRNSNSYTLNVRENNSILHEPQKPVKKEDQRHKHINESEKTVDSETEAPPSKRRCLDSFADASDSLMKQVAHLCTAVSPHVAAVAAESAITALCEENPYARMFIEGEEDNNANAFASSTSSYEPKRLLSAENSEMAEHHAISESQDGITEKNSTSVTLRIRTAIATAFGAAAAHAKLLADQEDREIEHLVATVIETQMRKIQRKIKHFEELQLIMEKEYNQIQELKESIIAERIDVLQKIFSAGITRWRDHSSVKATVGNVF